MNLLQTIDVIREHIEKATNPAIMCSFGKDSLVLVHITRTFLVDLPVIFYKEPTMPAKYRFARRVAEEWNLKVHEYLPARTGLQQTGSVVEFVNSYPIGEGLMNLALNRIEPKDGEEGLCGILDFLAKPVANSTFPFDVVFHGHKSLDQDPSYTNLRLKQQVVTNPGSATLVFPLKDWTDDDVWSYIEENQLPIHHDRYEKVDGKWQNKEDKTFNPDTFPLCAKCLLNNGPTYCQKFKREVPGRRDSITIQKPFIPNYVEET